MEKQLEEIKAENMKIRDLLNSKKNGDEIVETENEDIEVEVEIENESDMEENKCEKCEFIGKNKAGLKIHVAAKHKEKPLMQMFSRVSKNN